MMQQSPCILKHSMDHIGTYHSEKRQTIKANLIIQREGACDERFSFLSSTSYSLFRSCSNSMWTLLVQNPCSFFISRISIIVPARISRNNKGIKDTNNNDVRLFWYVTGLVRQTTTNHIKNSQKKAIGKAANVFPTFIFIISLWDEALSSWYKLFL